MDKERWIEIEDTINLIDEHIEIRNCSAKYICNKLNEQEHRIAELEEQLKNAIVPKFKVGDVLYYIFRDSVEFMRVNTISKFRDKEKDVFYGDGFGIYWNENELFGTKEEAQAKLEELRGENK